MDVLTLETCWEVNSEIIKQVTSSWSIFNCHAACQQAHLILSGCSNCRGILQPRLIWLRSPRIGTVSEVWYPDLEAQLIKFVWNRHQFLIRKNIRKCSYLDYMFLFVDVRHCVLDVLQCLYLSVCKFCSVGCFGLDSSDSWLGSWTYTVRFVEILWIYWLAEQL